MLGISRARVASTPARTSVAPQLYSTLTLTPLSAKNLEGRGRKEGRKGAEVQRGREETRSQRTRACNMGVVSTSAQTPLKPRPSSTPTHFLVVCTSSEATMVPARSSARCTGLDSGTASTQRAGLLVALEYVSSHTAVAGDAAERA